MAYPETGGILTGNLNASDRSRQFSIQTYGFATRIELGGLVFDAEKRVALGDETEVRFTKREWEVLSFFLASPNQDFPAEEILAQTWGTNASAEQLRTYITRMRHTLSPLQAWCKLVTEKG